ncbi:MAG: hypothetical protein Q8903_03350 [Bacteroidota bacterium]|nr:hypothetical protein [Bacteroidota bacterium]
MGFQVALDLAGSFIIGGMLLVQIMNIHGNAQTAANLYSQTSIVQRNLTTVVNILEYDFRKMGYGVSDPTKCIIRADSNRISYLSDINRNGNLDTITYYIGPASELSGTPNPNDKYLYRSVDGDTPHPSNLGVTDLHFRYYDQDMNVTSVLVAIKIVEISIAVQSIFPIDGQYPSAYWKQTRITSRNLNR